MIWVVLFVLVTSAVLFGRDPYRDRPASHAVHHATGEGPDCGCCGCAP